MCAKIYTKTGDQGQTSLVGGQRILKNDARIEAYGTVDELNAALGVARAALERMASLPKAAELNTDLETIQNWLFDLGSLLAATPEDRTKFALTPLTVERLQWMEARIDAATTLLQPLRNFILPSGCEAAAHLHVARTIARRAERCILVAGSSDDCAAYLPALAVPFINRLSDYLFVMARLANHIAGVGDVLWTRVTI